MELQTLKIKPRKPQQRVIDAAKKEGNPIPLDRQPFELQVPSYQVQDILLAAELNNQKVLGFLANLLNTEVVSTIRAQMNDDEQFPVDQEIDISNFDLESLTLDKLCESTTAKTSALSLEFTEDQFKEFVADFMAILLPQFAAVPRAENKLANTAQILVNGFKEVRNEPEIMERVKGTLDKFMESASDEIIDKYSDMYEYMVATFEKRLKAYNKKREKTDVFLD